MTAWQDRERAFEAKFARDEEFRFLATARRDKLLAQWAAVRFRLADPAAADLAASVLAVRDGAGHDERLLEHGACAAQARQQLLQGPRAPAA